MRALVVDDSRAMRMILGKILRSVGFDVIVEAGNGQEALERLEQLGAMDLALVDWNMPMLNGYEFVSRVRAERRYKWMRLMMVTTEIEATQMQKALDAGADEYLMKPFMREAVLEKLQILGLMATGD
jgi:two-component system chemotaxis response regulator CheY